MSLSGEFWLGLEKIHSLSKGGNYILNVQFSDWRDDVQTINYPFRLNGKESNYSLRILGSPSGNLESSLSTETSGVPFSTRDKDNDQKNDLNCAKQLSGKIIMPWAIKYFFLCGWCCGSNWFLFLAFQVVGGLAIAVAQTWTEGILLLLHQSKDTRESKECSGRPGAAATTRWKPPPWWLHPSRLRTSHSGPPLRCVEKHHS